MLGLRLKIFYLCSLKRANHPPPLATLSLCISNNPILPNTIQIKTFDNLFQKISKQSNVLLWFFEYAIIFVISRLMPLKMKIDEMYENRNLNFQIHKNVASNKSVS